MRVIHLSDIHHAIGDSGQEKVLSALCRDLATIAEEKHIDAVIFSGDLASKGKTDNATTDDIFSTIITPIRNAIPYSTEFVICPGNHDVNLSARDQIYNPIFDKINSPGDASKLIEKVHAKSGEIWAHMDGYIRLAKKISPDAYDTNPIYRTIKLKHGNVTIGIASLNSTWLTRGGGNADYGKLFIGERQIDLALKEISGCEIKLAVMHHTLNWLHPQEVNVVQRVLAANFHAVLCGHNHENTASSIVSNIGALFVSNTGCLYQTHEYFNGYSILDCDLENRKWVVNAREYFYQREAFDISSRFSEGGISEYDMKNAPGTNVIVIPASVISEVQERASSVLLSYAASDIAPKQVGAMFVDPLLSKVSEKQLTAATSREKTADYLTLSQLANSNDSLLIVGKREAGKTVLLHQIAANRFIEFKSNARIGLVIDLTTVAKLTEAALLEQLVEATGGELRRRDIVELLKGGRILVCIDNLQIHADRQITLVREFCEKYPSARYIVAASEEFFDSININDAVPIFGIPFQRVFIHSFRRKQIREMARKWFGDSSLHTNIKFELVNQLLVRLNVPTTPFLVSVLLWVLEQRPNASPVNQAAAIEVLIDGLLEKFKESKSRMGFDSNIQRHFLSDFSEHLDSIEAEWIAAIDFDYFVVAYFKRKGLQVSTSGFAEELLRKGLLYSTADRVAFKFDCFRAYFLAQRFVDTPTLWQKALSESGINRYATEIDLFTGLHRNRRDVLETSFNVCKDLFEKSGFDIQLNKIEELSKHTLLITDVGLDSLESDILGVAYDSDKREDRLSEMEQPSPVSVDHEKSRRRNQFGPSSDQSSFIASLRILSIVVRNSELVDDVNLKRESLSLAIEYWAKILVSALEMVSTVDIDTDEFKTILMLKGNEETVRQLMRLIIPQALVSMMSECLSTPKLQPFLAEIGSVDEPIVSCLASLAALDGGEKEGAAMVRAVLQKYGKNGLIAQIVFFKLMSIYFLKYMDGGQISGIRDCLAEAFAVFRGASARVKAGAKAKFLETLDRKLSTQDLTREKD